MSTPSLCNPSRLRELLSVVPGERPVPLALEDHLSHCDNCRRELEHLAADSWWWDEGREILQSSIAIDLGESLPQVTAVVGLDDVVGQDDAFCQDDAQPAVPDPLDLSFLDSPRHPELLGRLGKYEIESVVGRGGMGVVLKGFDTELNRVVAIKVLSPQLASNGAARQRFAREARAAAAVVHDHVVAIYGIETGCDLPYIVMPFVEGASLQRFVELHGPVDVKDIVRIAMQIASGLSAAHEQGLVHRDIKPANILLQDGLSRVLITDFGLARAADDASLTRTGLVAGTPHYMSPEQANGSTVDPRSDLFSLGSVVYFMATGRPPFRAGSAMAVLNQICHKQARPLREINADVPQPLAAIVQRLLQKHPENRMYTARGLRELLAAYLAHLQDPSRHELPSSLRDQRSSRKRRASLAFVVAALMLLAATVLFSGVFPRNNRPLAQAAVGAADDEATADEAAIARRQSNERSLAAALASLGRAGQSEFDGQTAELSLSIDSLQSAFAQPVLQLPLENNSDGWQEQLARVELLLKALEQPHSLLGIPMEEESTKPIPDWDDDLSGLDAAIEEWERSIPADF